MISFRDMTFCSGAGCTRFRNCPRALTNAVRGDAAVWWEKHTGKKVVTDADIMAAPIAQFSDPTQLECYRKPA